MTDKPTPSLNLIERMAQRLAKQEGEVARPESNRAQASVAAESVPRAEPQIAPIERSALSVNGEVQRSSVLAPEPVRRSSSEVKSREVHLDFQVLRQNGMITPDNMSSAISNEFRGIKRKLLHKARNPETRAAVNNLVMVTSTLPGEGKTFSSINLAISLAAERGMHVLLIDADIVRPSIGNVFKSVPKEGLTDLLSGKVSNVSDVMCRCAEIPNLAVMFSGGVHANSPELISSGKMAELCTDLSAHYPDRMIIIDTPPVLASPEPASLAAYVHQLIMVVAADQTDRHQLQRSLELVGTCKDISLLFNKAPRWNEAKYSAYYGYSNYQATPAASS